MKWKMLFRIGLTVVILVAILLFYLNNVMHKDYKERLSELVKSDSQAFQEALVRQGSHGANGGEKHDSNFGGDVEVRENQYVQLGGVHGGGKGGEKGDSWQGHAVENPATVDHSVNDPAKLGNSVHNPVMKDKPDQGRHMSGGSAAGLHRDASSNGAASGFQPLHHRWSTRAVVLQCT